MWTYAADFTSDRDQVRFYLQDTDSNRQLIQDEEIEFLVANENDALGAAARGAEILASRFSAGLSFTADGITVDTQSLAERYNDLAKSLRALADRDHRLAKPYVGGIFRSDVEKDRNNENLIPLSIQSHMHDNPRSPDVTNEDSLKGYGS